MIKDFEDPAIGAGILSQNENMFNVKDQIEWLKNHSQNFNKGKQIVEALQVSNIFNTIMFDILHWPLDRMQKAGRDFLAGIGANIGGGSRRMPELCCISLEVTACNPTRSFRKVVHTLSPTIIHPLVYAWSLTHSLSGLFARTLPVLCNMFKQSIWRWRNICRGLPQITKSCYKSIWEYHSLGYSSTHHKVDVQAYNIWQANWGSLDSEVSVRCCSKCSSDFAGGIWWPSPQKHQVGRIDQRCPICSWVSQHSIHAACQGAFFNRTGSWTCWHVKGRSPEGFSSYSWYCCNIKQSWCQDSNEHLCRRFWKEQANTMFQFSVHLKCKAFLQCWWLTSCRSPRKNVVFSDLQRGSAWISSRKGLSWLTCNNARNALAFSINTYK